MKNLKSLAAIVALCFLFAGVPTAEGGIIVNDRSITSQSCSPPSKEKTGLDTIASIVGIIVNGLTGIIVNDIKQTEDVMCGIIVND